MANIPADLGNAPPPWAIDMINNINQRFDKVHNRIKDLENIIIKAFNASAFKQGDVIRMIRGENDAFPENMWVPTTRGELDAATSSRLLALLQFYQLSQNGIPQMGTPVHRRRAIALVRHLGLRDY